jgi:hypothetical protein
MTNPLPSLPCDQRKIDADHLNLLAIFHFVGAGLAVLVVFTIVVLTRDSVRELYSVQSVSTKT